MSKFGKALSAQREKRDMTYRELASKSGVSFQYIFALEKDTPHGSSGKRPEPRVETVDSLAKALDWDQAEARMLAGYLPADFPEPIIDALRMLQDLTAADWKEIAEFIKFRVASKR